MLVLRAVNRYFIVVASWFHICRFLEELFVLSLYENSRKRLALSKLQNVRPSEEFLFYFKKCFITFQLTRHGCQCDQIWIFLNGNGNELSHKSGGPNISDLLG